LVACIGTEVVVAFREGDNVTLRGLVASETIPMAFMRQVPDHQPAPIEALNIRLNATNTPEMAKLRRLVRTGRIGYGELYVGMRNQQYEYHSTVDRPVRYADYPAGRVVIAVAAGHVSVAPVTKVTLRRRLEAEYQAIGRH
jgi:hypothetical protein